MLIFSLKVLLLPVAALASTPSFATTGAQPPSQIFMFYMFVRLRELDLYLI